MFWVHVSLVAFNCFVAGICFSELAEPAQKRMPMAWTWCLLNTLFAAGNAAYLADYI